MPLAPAGSSSHSPAFRDVLRLVEMYAGLPRPVVLIGPTGSGKGYLAKLLHKLAAVPGPMIEVTGGQLTETLLQSQLFGHVSGAFTGAQKATRGAFAQADRGTLFLDEIQHWGPVVQSALLRTLGEGMIRPLGSEREFPMTCRLVFASTRPLSDLVADGLLLPDLRWRMSGFEIEVPPLSSRGGDVLQLADWFITKARAEFGIVYELTLAPETVATLLAYSWPGNLRELCNVIELGSVHACARGGLQILTSDLPSYLQTGSLPLSQGPLEARQAAVEWMLPKVQGNQSEAARRLGLHRNTIARRAMTPRESHQAHTHETV